MILMNYIPKYQFFFSNAATIVLQELSDKFRSYSTIVRRRRRYVCLLQLREAKKTTAAAAWRAAAAAKRPLLSFDSTPCYSSTTWY